jgi:lipopolysaccharide export system permease protein
MYRYSKYIAKHLLHATLLITLSLTSIVWLTQALRFIDFIVNQGVSITIFLKLTMLLIPSLLLMILPPAMFCALLFVYNKLKVDSELVVLQAAGLNRWRLAVPGLQVGALMMVITYFIALYLQPVSYSRFREMQAFLRNNYASILLQEGVFNSPVQGLTVFVRERERSGTLRGILVHDNRNSAQPITMMAEEGQLVDTPQGPRFLLQNGNRQEIQNGKTAFLNFQSYTLDMSLYAKEMSGHHVDARELFLGELFKYDDTISPAENQKRRAEAHQRLIWPGYVLCLTLVAVAVLLSGEFNRRGHWRRIVLAVICGVVILFSAVGLRGLMALHSYMVPVAYLNLLLPTAIASWILTDHIRRMHIAARQHTQPMQGDMS